MDTPLDGEKAATSAMTPDADGFMPHTSHWGVFSARLQDDVLEVRPYPGDPDPNGIIGNFPAALRHRARIAQPMVRRGWLERGPGPDDRARPRRVRRRWPGTTVLDLLGAGAAPHPRHASAPGAVFGGSYGWSSAGRFHHAQSQVHRFLNIALRRLCALGQQLQLRRVLGDPAAYPRRVTRT